MNLRSGHQKPARNTSVEDEDECRDEEDKGFITEDRSDQAFENGHKSKKLDGEKIILESGIIPHYTLLYTLGKILNRYKEYVMFVILPILFFALLRQGIYPKVNTEHSGSDCRNALAKLYQEYPEFETFWKDINVTYNVCSKSDKPGVILVLHNGNGSVANCIVTRTAPLLSKLIGVNQSGEYFSVDGSTAHQDYEPNSFLSIVMKKRNQLGVVVFTHLEQMDSQLFKDLHFICDSDSNMSNKAIIILVLKVETQTFENKNLEDMAKTLIRRLWKKALDYHLQPIIGRITNIVASIDENVTIKCP